MSQPNYIQLIIRVTNTWICPLDEEDGYFEHGRYGSIVTCAIDEVLFDDFVKMPGILQHEVDRACSGL